MKTITLYQLSILALMVFSAVGLELKVNETLIFFITLSPFLLALALSLSAGFSTKPARLTAFTLPSLLFFFYAFHPWFARRDVVAVSSSTAALDFIIFPITACMLGFACLALFEIVSAIVGNKVDKI